MVHGVVRRDDVSVACRVGSNSTGTCAEGLAWADKAYATDTAHSEVECSNAGICNRGTGICDCFDPFTGAACQRGAGLAVAVFLA